MTNYLLLRNNKESGPYSIDDLARLGLKAYDLVWVQGKSAAWRYPSEIDELKAFAPVVEEQPFDRFYKKSREVKEEAVKQETPFIAPEHEKYVPKKSVFVTMPGGQKITTTQPVKNELLPRAEGSKPMPVPIQQTITISENPNTAQIKYSQPLDDIKEMYVKTLHNRKQKIARKNFWMQNLKKAAVIVGLIAMGMVAGLVFKSGGNKKELVAQRQETIQSKPQPQVPESKTLATPESNNQYPDKDKSSLASPGEIVQTLPPPTGGFVNKKAQEQHKDPVGVDKSTDKPISGNVKKELVLNSPENDFSNGLAAPNPDNDPRTGERNKKVRSGNDDDHRISENKSNDEKSFASNELGSLVTVTSNEYKKVAFGGIRDLQLTVTNDSKYILDNVTVELQYIKPNELPLRTENIQFKSVGPNATSTIRIPDTNRGIKVTYKIIHIKSRQIDEGVAGNQ
jgi:hypothetical protein